MSPERWQKINDIFQSVIAFEDHDEQRAYLKKACAGDESLQNQVETLIAANDEAGTFIDGNAAEDVEHLLPEKNTKTLSGSDLGHYKILSILGSGGMGKVYLAKDSKLNRFVAVKTLPPSFSRKTEYIKRFQTEAKAAANLNHPNAATVYSVEETNDKQIFITMEYVDGKSLSELIPSHGIKMRVFLEWFTSLADAFAHAHEKGVVHRDIKPSNIIITPAGVPKILDFGLARIDKTKITEKDSTLSLTKSGQVLGTPAYMSPEQAEGKETDHRTDIFSLGVVMYEAITGTKPFKGDNFASIISSLMTKDPPEISQIKPQVPYLLTRLIMKCLNKEPRYRYQSMNEVRVILKEVEAAITSGASLSRPAQITLVKPNRLKTGIFAGIFALLALTAGIAIWKLVTAPQPENKKVVKLSLPSPTGDISDLLSTMISPDGKNLVIPFSKDGASYLNLRPLDKFEATPIKGTEGGDSPFFSYDGQWILFWENQKNIKKIPIDGGVATTICENCLMQGGADWGSDGTIIFTDSRNLYRVSSDGGVPEKLLSIDPKAGEKSFRAPQILPDNKTILFDVNIKGKHKVAFLSLETKERRILEEIGVGSYPKYIPSTEHLVFSRNKQLFGVKFDLKTLKSSGKPIVVLNNLFNFLPDINITKNGTLLYLPATSDKGNSLVWLDRNGKSTPIFAEKNSFFGPRLSPDGKKITVIAEDDAWVYEIDTGKNVRLSFGGISTFSLWTPDGNSIIYSVHNDNDDWILYQKNTDGSGDAKQIYSSKTEFRPYSVHPTGEIVLASDFPASGKGRIISISLETGKTETIVEAPLILDMPRFSPDGKWMAYFSIESGERQIFVRSWDETKSRFLISKTPGLFPVWSRDNREILFRRGENFFSTKIQTSSGFQATAATQLFRGKYRTNFDLSPDGKRILAVKTEKGVFPTKINLILNWTEELKKTMEKAR